MVARAVHHVSLNVTDVPACVAFYTALGFREIERPAFDFDGAWMRLGDSGELHLLGFPPPKAVGQHFAVEVADLAEALVELSNHGIEPTRSGEISGICRQAFLTDPSGNEVELNQPL
ncbi:MAG: VOC family protein [Actinomycetota bacterium]